eukprot:g32150.t1
MVFLPPEHNQLNRKRMPTDNIETKETKYPLLLYLHGAGEMRGELSDIISEGATGTPPVELAFGRAAKTLSERFVVVAPHTTEGWSVKLIGKFLDFLLSEKFEKCRLCLDPSRLYVTGHSMGGAGALHAATSARFAAAVPVAPSAAPRANLLEDFGEGLAQRRGQLWQLLWKTGKGIRYSAQAGKDGGLNKTGRFQTPLKDGWGIEFDGEHMLCKDSGHDIFFLDPDDFHLKKKVSVTDGGRFIEMINEMEIIGRVQFPCAF